jgi:hypothetical protein
MHLRSPRFNSAVERLPHQFVHNAFNLSETALDRRDRTRVQPQFKVLLVYPVMNRRQIVVAHGKETSFPALFYTQ